MTEITGLTSRECKAYLDGGRGLAVVPSASPERLGPHLPLGTRAIVAECAARLIAEENDGLYIPLIPYGTVYDTHAQRGSIDIETKLMHRYMTDVCDELYSNKFERVVIVGFADEYYYLAHEYFQLKNYAVAFMCPDSFFNAEGTVASKLDADEAELWRLSACLKISGKDDMLAKVLKLNSEYLGKRQRAKDQTREAHAKFGLTGHNLREGEWRFYPAKLGGVSGSRGKPEDELVKDAAEEFINWTKSLSGAVASLSSYQDFLNAHPAERAVY